MTREEPIPTPAVAEAPVYSDRSSGTIYDDAFDMVNAYLRRYAERGLEVMPLDPTGYSQIKRGSAHIGINVLEDTGMLMLLAPILEVTEVTPADREQLYRKLLELSFLTTAEASFAIDGKKDLIYVRALRRLSGLDYEEFEDLLQTVGKVADEFDDALKQEFG